MKKRVVSNPREDFVKFLKFYNSSHLEHQALKAAHSLANMCFLTLSVWADYLISLLFTLFPFTAHQSAAWFASSFALFLACNFWWRGWYIMSPEAASYCSLPFCILLRYITAGHLPRVNCGCLWSFRWLSCLSGLLYLPWCSISRSSSCWCLTYIPCLSRYTSA